jgi:outer membrane protein assembly factor BamB
MKLGTIVANKRVLFLPLPFVLGLIAICAVLGTYPVVVQALDNDWPMMGQRPSRQAQIELPTAAAFDFELRGGKGVAWSAKLGSQTYGSPIVSQGKVLIGTNNGGNYRSQHQGDRGVLLCFDEQTGEFLWQLTRQKLEDGNPVDWAEQGIASNPVVEGDRLYLVTNRCELMCLDLNGFIDGENDGAVTDEVDREQQDADIVWTLDMRQQLGVYPRNLATSSPVIHGDLVFAITSNGVDESQTTLPSPEAPNFVAVNKQSGAVVWQTNRLADRVLHGQWGSPAVGMINGRAQVIFPGGDGWVYAFEPDTGKELWRFDCNPKAAIWEMGGAGDRNYIVATPVVADNSVIIAVGQDPEHGDGVGHLWRIDATKSGDISAEIGEMGQPGQPNPNSGAIWHYGGSDDDQGSVTGEANEPIMRRTIATAAVAGDLVFIPDIAGFFHCVDWKTGERVWAHDLMTGIWGSATVVAGHVLIGTEDGKLVVMQAARELEVVKELDTVNYSAIYSTPTVANGHLLLSDRSKLYRIKLTD